MAVHTEPDAAQSADSCTGSDLVPVVPAKTISGQLTRHGASSTHKCAPARAQRVISGKHRQPGATHLSDFRGVQRSNRGVNDLCHFQLHFDVKGVAMPRII